MLLARVLGVRFYCALLRVHFVDLLGPLCFPIGATSPGRARRSTSGTRAITIGKVLGGTADLVEKEAHIVDTEVDIVDMEEERTDLW